MKKIAVLGAGMVGRAMAIDLAKDYDVVSVDLDTEALSRMRRDHGIATRQADLSDPQQVKKTVAGMDLVVGAVPGFLGFRVLEAVIEAGVHAVDISFFNENPFDLDELARTNGVTAVMDIGVAPGMDNIILGYHLERMEVNRFECLVGGLPRERRWPYEYKAPFSPIDVLEEYTRPARIVVGGQVVVKPALSEIEPLDFEGVGTLEAFNSDGLRSLVQTCSKVPNMIERTLRYPGHATLMRALRETGFFSKEPIEIRGQSIRPLDLSARLLFPMWKLGEQEEEFTVMRVTVEGPARAYTYDLLDRYDAATQTSSMARTTGYTATGAARLVLEGRYKHAGISPPEYLGKSEENFRFLLAHLAARGVHYRVRETKA
ncbi:MAG: saccharopine dehydrogenase [Bacteroidetes bacterium]|nr:saccharopine dehydrogenase [Bacteroidota bacterium]